MTPAPLDLDALEAKLSAATPGPWDAGHLVNDDHPCNCRYIYGNNDSFGAVGQVHVDDGENDCPSVDEAKANLRLIVALRNAAPALIAMARRAQQDSLREGTHAPDCHLWGPRHYDCLMREYEASRAEIARLRATRQLENEGRDQVVKTWHERWRIYAEESARLRAALEAAGEALALVPEMRACLHEAWFSSHEDTPSAASAEYEAKAIENTASDALAEVRDALGSTNTIPDATEADGVCVGEHVAISLADEAAAKIARLREALVAAEPFVEEEVARYAGGVVDVERYGDDARDALAKVRAALGEPLTSARSDPSPLTEPQAKPLPPAP